MEKPIIKFIWKGKTLKYPKQFLKGGNIGILDIKAYYIDVVIKSVWHWQWIDT